jgi:hypothetical protein
MTIRCTLCEDSGWVCENHTYRPWTGEHACPCGGAGAPCMACNPSDEHHAPRLPEDFKIKIDKDGWRH